MQIFETFRDPPRNSATPRLKSHVLGKVLVPPQIEMRLTAPKSNRLHDFDEMHKVKFACIIGF